MMNLEAKMSDRKKTELVIHSVNELTLDFPEKKSHISSKEAENTRNLIKENGAYSPDGRTYVNTKALSHLLATDQKGVKRFYNNLDDDDKFQNGKSKFASVPSVNKEISKRLEEPRGTLKRERLKDSEKCINVMRDAPEIEKCREVEESKNRHGQKKLKSQKVKK